MVWCNLVSDFGGSRFGLLHTHYTAGLEVVLWCHLASFRWGTCWLQMSQGLHIFFSQQYSLDYSQERNTYLIEIKYSVNTLFFFGSVTATAPSRGLTDNKKKRGERAQAEEKAKGSCSRRPRTKERKPGKRKKTQVEYRGEGAQDRRRRRKPGGWKETPNTRKRGGDAQSCSC